MNKSLGKKVVAYVRGKTAKRYATKLARDKRLVLEALERWISKKAELGENLFVDGSSTEIDFDFYHIPGIRYDYAKKALLNMGFESSNGFHVAFPEAGKFPEVDELKDWYYDEILRYKNMFFGAALADTNVVFKKICEGNCKVTENPKVLLVDFTSKYKEREYYQFCVKEIMRVNEFEVHIYSDFWSITIL